MAENNAVELIKRGDKRFSARASLDGMRHEIALNFAPLLARWTSEPMLGEDYANHMVDGTPALLARDFVSQIGAMLRPPGKQWFWFRTSNEHVNSDVEARAYLDWRSQRLMRILNDRVTGFSAAVKQADEFFGLMGDAVLSVDMGNELDSLRIKNWHTANVTWAIGADNQVDTITRRERVAVRNVLRRFRQKGDVIHPKLKELAEKDGEATVEIRHDVLPADEYDAYIKGSSLKRKDGFASVWIDVTNRCVIRETHQPTLRYVVPRWVTLTDCAYAISPAATIALPDARLLQQQAAAILEAAEKQINPPLIAQGGGVISGNAVKLESSGITWLDRSYDERMGEPVKPLELGKNFQLGIDNMMRTEGQLSRAFYLDKLRLPDTRNSKSTMEIQFLIDEYVRSALPLFAPMQVEYNDGLLYEVDKLVQQFGGYEGREMPEILKAKPEFTFQWDNPLSDMMERQKSQMVAEISQIAQTVAALDAAAAQTPSLQQIDTGKMFRETVMGLGAASWVLSQDEADERAEATSAAAQQQQMLAAAPDIARVIDSGVNAAATAATIPSQGEPGFSLPMPV
jgi:hypothetical protein